MKEIHSERELLAESLRENGWTNSKSTDKLIALMAGFKSIPWEKVKLFMLKWDTINGIPLPYISIAMHGEESNPEISGLEDWFDEDEIEKVDTIE